MASFTVSNGLESPEVRRLIQTVRVYDMVVPALGPAILSPGRASVGVSPLRSRAFVRASANPDLVAVHADEYIPGFIKITPTVNSRDTISIPARLRIYGRNQSASYIRPADDNELPESERQKVSDVELDLHVSYDSYFKFEAKSADGFRAVLDDHDVLLQSSGNGYEVEADKLGKKIRRTVITNSDFQLTLNLNPTVVKNAAALTI